MPSAARCKGQRSHGSGFNAAVVASSKSSWSTCLALLQLEGSRPDTVSLNLSVTSLHRAGRWRLALSLLRLPIQRDAVTVAAAAQAAAPGGHAAVLAVLRGARVALDAVAACAAVAAARGWRGALAVLQAVEAKDVSAANAAMSPSPWRVAWALLHTTARWGL